MIANVTLCVIRPPGDVVLTRVISSRDVESACTQMHVRSGICNSGTHCFLRRCTRYTFHRNSDAASSGLKPSPAAESVSCMHSGDGTAWPHSRHALRRLSGTPIAVDVIADILDTGQAPFSIMDMYRW